MIKKIIKISNLFIVLALFSCSAPPSSSYYDSYTQVQKELKENLLKQYKSAVTSVSVNTANITLYVGHKLKVSASVTHLDLSINNAVEWISSDNTIAMVDNDGNISGIKEGFTTVIVSSIEDKGINYKIGVVIKNQEFEEALVNIDTKEATLKIGEKFKLNATVKLSNGTISPNVIWKSEDESIAEVSQDGIVTAKKAGETKIFALAEGNQSKSAYAKIIIK